ncbi:hypothetical protein SOVF_211840 isoform A [Spinacia oleracea]|nr:hypothetical protein SOVF_211840 isoform A [Spinacia oleracea]
MGYLFRSCVDDDVENEAAISSGGFGNGTNVKVASAVVVR